MSKSELVAAVSEKTGMSKKDCEKVIAGCLDTVAETLAQGGKVQLVGFGTFEVKERRARTGRNPQTGEPVEIPASKAPVFKAGKALKGAVAK